MRKKLNDERFMRAAIGLARRGHGNVAPNPSVGCVIVRENRIIGRGWTQPGGRPHAETEALAQAGKKASGSDVYVTLEPCAMCAGALINSRMGRLVYGASAPKAGAVHSLYLLLEDERLNHSIPVESGVCAEQCGEVLKVFFRQLRTEKKKSKDKNEKHG